MSFSKKLYSFMFITCMAGYIWLYFGLSNTNNKFEVCLIKRFTNIPCPSCGSTRSVISLTKGNFIEAININPIGILVAIIMVITPIWIIVDIITKRKHLFDFYQKIETLLKTPKYSVILILLVIINWTWNILKGF